MAIVKLSNGVDINYNFKQIDSKAETLVFINGTFSVLQDWDSVGDYLLDNCGYNVLTFDMRNQGGSSKIRNEFEYTDLVKDVELLIEHFNLSQFTIVTYSSASTIAIDYILQKPDKVKRLIMGAPAVNPFGAFKSQLIYEASMRLLELSDMNDLVVLTYPLMFSKNFCEENEKNFSLIQEQFNTSYDKTLLLPYMRAWDKNEMNLHKLQTVINSVETYFIYGEEDILNHPKDVQRLQDKLEKFNVYKISNAGHGFHSEDMDGYISILENILNK